MCNAFFRSVIKAMASRASGRSAMTIVDVNRALARCKPTGFTPCGEVIPGFSRSHPCRICTYQAE